MFSIDVVASAPDDPSLQNLFHIRKYVMQCNPFLGGKIYIYSLGVCVQFFKIRVKTQRSPKSQIFTYLRTLQSSDRNEDFLRVKEDEAKEQHKSIIEALKAAAPEWTFEQINFVAGRRGAAVGNAYAKRMTQ